MTPQETPQNTGDPAVPGDSERAAALAAEVGEMKDRLLRTLAEMENLRRRTEREIADTRAYAVANFARDMLVVGDNLRRAIAAVPADARDGRDPALNVLIEGVEVTERGMSQTLQKFGVKPIEAKGEKFDPEVHQAMYEVETADLPPGHVAEVVQAGYVIGERTLRPALVAVSKAAQAKPAETPAPANSN
ncbi:MAG: nucleotide exchange factor GrpE [Bauldia sp.]